MTAMETALKSGKWGQNEGDPKAVTLLAAVTTAEEPPAVLKTLKEQGLNLYKTLTPQHLGKFMATGAITWGTLAQWTAAKGVEATAAVASEPTMTQQKISERKDDQEGPTYFILQGKSRRLQQVSEEGYADIRQKYPPQDPAIHEAAYGGLLRKPRSPQTTQLCRFRPVEETDTRTRRWQWWEALSKVKVYVREYYQFTKWAAKINAAAAGTPGQEVARTSKGTVTLIPNDTRINI